METTMMNKSRILLVHVFELLRVLVHVLKVIRSKVGPRIGHLDKRFSNGWRKHQLTLVVSHKVRP